MSAIGIERVFSFELRISGYDLDLQGNPATQEAMVGELVWIAVQGDSVLFDMAMLVPPDVFERT